MAINRIRELRRKEIAKMEVNNMLRKYPYECSKVISRQATAEELTRVGNKTNEKEYKMLLRNDIGTY